MGLAASQSPKLSQACCHECGQRYRYQSIAPGATACCMRCGTVLYRNRRLSFDKALAYTIAAVILFVLANSFPFLGFGFPGEIRYTTLITGSLQLYQQEEVLLAFIVLFTSVVAPAVQLLLLLYLLIPVNLGYKPREIPHVLKLMLRMRYWSMMDVFLLGILVSAVKLSDMATIVAGPALLAFLTLIFMLAAAQAAFDSQRVWSMVKLPNQSRLTDKAKKLVECHVCQLAVPMLDKPKKNLDCPRCLTPLHYRKPDSLQRTWALVLAALVCYVPANMIPIMKTTSVAGTQFDTIMSGIIYLISHGSWPVGLIVLIASVVVPLLKIAILIFLLVSIQLRSRWRPRERTQLYRWAELVGKWSMVDIFVVNTLVALVQMGSLASIEAGAGALFFCAVVILTMFAAMSFDPRLIWDKLENDSDRVSAKYA
jgi:paraquat-inducible protein A